MSSKAQMTFDNLHLFEATFSVFVNSTPVVILTYTRDTNRITSNPRLATSFALNDYASILDDVLYWTHRIRLLWQPAVTPLLLFSKEIVKTATKIEFKHVSGTALHEGEWLADGSEVTLGARPAMDIPFGDWVEMIATQREFLKLIQTF